MPRPNLAQDAPPTEITVGGVSYAIDCDFRTWIDVTNKLQTLRPEPETPEQAAENTQILIDVENLVFGRMIPHPAVEVLTAITEFASGYPEAPVSAGKQSNVKTYSLDWDINYIVVAIMNQFGIDLTWRRKEPFHWWEFLVYFRALSGNHYILRLMEIRGYDGKDEDLKRQAYRFALPQEDDAEDQEILDEFDQLFYNA